MKFDDWWDKTVFFCGFSQHKTIARSVWEEAKERDINILKDMMLELEKDLNQPYYHSDYYKKIEAKIDILEDAIYKIENE